jgi:hypothetical protein
MLSRRAEILADHIATFDRSQVPPLLKSLSTEISFSFMSSPWMTQNLPPRPRMQREIVLRKLENIIGVKPTRSELIEFARHFSWVEIGRNEKRVKALLIEKLDTHREQILPFLDSDYGREAVRKLYVKMLSRKQFQGYVTPTLIAFPKVPWSPQMPEVMRPEITVGFYLNHH